MSKERPILFNTKMVQAIRDGRKTQTRRIVKNQDGIHPRRNNIGWVGWDDGHGCRLKPPCEVGDILWVRETWCDPEPDNFMVPVFYKADMPLHWDAEDTAHGEAVDITAEDFKWRPSIHMPKEAARIFLRVKDVWPERLLDPFFKNRTAILTVCNEGVDVGETCRTCIETYGFPCCIDDVDDTECCMLDDPRYMFSKLWDSTIKPADLDKYGWKANPWVWVITFERCDRPKGWC